MNTAASIRQRLLNISREQRVDFNRILTNYGLERLLYRLSNSKYKDEFTLKGAMLFSYWSGDAYLTQVFTDLCEQNESDDGLVFSAKKIHMVAFA